MEGGGGHGKVFFLSKMKLTLMINLTYKETNLTLRQMTLLYGVEPSQLTVHTIYIILE